VLSSYAAIRKATQTHTHTHNRLTALFPGPTG